MTEKTKLETTERHLTPNVAIYVMAIGAARADNVEEESEINAIKEVASVFGHETHYEDASAYFSEFHSNENAIGGAIKVLKDGNPSAKLAAVVFMKYVLGVDGISQEESAFYNKVVDQIQ